MIAMGEVGSAGRHEERAELRLAALALRNNDQPLRDRQLLIFAPFDPHFRLALSHAVALKA
jgi:hypothetical protein